MGDLNNDSNVGTWPVSYRDKPLSNGQSHDPQFRGRIADAYFGYHTETVRRKMLEHEAIFKTQLYELHRLYRVQKEMMDDMKMNELQKQSMAIETSLSSCSASQTPDAQRKLTSLPFPLAGSTSAQLNGGGEDFHSVPDFSNNRHSRNYLISSTNLGSSKNCEVEMLECRRPSTTSIKFDLELHADEDINVEEPKYCTQNPHGMSHHLSNEGCEVPTYSRSKMFLSQSQSIKIDSRGDHARQNKGNNGLTDRNQQIQTQGVRSSSLSFVGCNSNFRSHQQLCSKSQLQTFPWDSTPNSHFVCDASGSRNLTMAHRDNARESEHSKNQITAFSQNLLPENIDFFRKYRNASYFQTNQTKADYQLKERSEGGPKYFGNNFLNCLSDSHLERSFPISNEPWEKPSSCATQKLATSETYPFINSTSTLPRSSQSSRKNAWSPIETWHINVGSGVNSDYQNGLYKGFSSGSGPRCRPTIGYTYWNRSNDTYMASGASVCQNSLVKFNGLPSVDASSTKGFDLNITSVADKHDYDDRPIQDHDAHFQWGKSSTGLKNGTIKSFNGCVMGQNSGPASGAYDIEMKANTAKTIMGVPAFGVSSLSKGSLSCRSSLCKEEEMGKNGRVWGFDMNVPCEYEEKEMETHVVDRRNLIDLNMCLADDDAVMEIPSPCSHTEKTIRGFDLEASCDIEEEDMNQPKQPEPENSDGSLVTAATEAIVTISCMKLAFADSPRNPAAKTPPDILKWFVDIVSSCPDDADKVSQEKSDEDSDSVDYFECMTLKLTEIKEDDYLHEYPKAPEPEEGKGTGMYTTRTRKGQARQGRPRRDFQRDILPGLTSLARHEVTEDLQTFGGLMRAAGHSWQSSLTRRTGAKRGRPRLTRVQPPIPVPTPNLSSPSCSQLPPKKSPSPLCSASSQKRKTSTPKEFMNMKEDHGHLTVWGKTTRRPRRQPRRQRCSTAPVVQYMN